MEHYAKERELKQYYEQHYGHSPSLSMPSVPSAQPNLHRSRSQGHAEEQLKTVKGYRVREQKPPAFLDQSDIPVRPKHQPRRPSIKVEIHQDLPTKPSSVFTNDLRKDTNSALPELYHEFVTTVNKLTEVGILCSRKSKFDTDVPGKLSFSSIAEHVNGQAFRLKVWGHEIGIEGMTAIDFSRQRAVQLASRTLERLLDRAYQLGQACSKAQSGDLKYDELPDISSDDGWESDASEHQEEIEDPTASLGFAIKSYLDSISLQIQTLSRLTRTVQDATLLDRGRNPEVEAVDSLVREVDLFFGSPEALQRYLVDGKFRGRKALEEARYTAGENVGASR